MVEPEPWSSRRLLPLPRSRRSSPPRAGSIACAVGCRARRTPSARAAGPARWRRPGRGLVGRRSRTTLLIADLGTATTVKVVERLREEMASRGVRTRRRPGRSCARSSSRSCVPRWIARSAPFRTAIIPPCCSSSASTAPARPPRPANSPGSWSQTADASCAAPPTPSCGRGRPVADMGRARGCRGRSRTRGR